MNCELRPRPLDILIVSWLTLTCDHRDLSNGDMCIEASSCEKMEKWAREVDEMTENGKDERTL